MQTLKKIIRDSGESDFELTLPSKVYIDSEMRRLNSVYDIFNHPGEIVGSSLGSAGIESFVSGLFRFYQMLRTPVGLRKEDYEILSNVFDEQNYSSWLFSRGFMRKECIQGAGVLFPIEELFVSQRVNLRKLS